MDRPIAAFISQRPHDNAGMVLVPHDHALTPFKKSRRKIRIVAQVHEKSVGLDVGFVNHIEAVRIAQRIPQGIIGIMGRPNRIEIELLHQNNILHHILFCHGFSTGVTVVMPVDAFYKHRFAIDQEKFFTKELIFTKAEQEALEEEA